MSYSNTYVHYHSGGPSKSGFPLVLHTHAQYEIYYLIEGRRSYLFENSRYNLEPGDFALIAPNVKHITRGDSYKRAVIYISDEFIMPDLMPYIKKCFDAVLIKTPPSYQRKFLDIIDNLSRETSFNMAGNSVMISALVSELIIELYRFMETGSNSSVSKKDGVTNKILETVSYINQHYMENMTVDSLAAKTFISKSHFCHQFKKITNCSPMDYVNSIRLKSAQHLLESSSLTIAQIAESTGFSSSNYFGDIFLKHFGVSPREYRRNLIVH